MTRGLKGCCETDLSLVSQKRFSGKRAKVPKLRKHYQECQEGAGQVLDQDGSQKRFSGQRAKRPKLRRHCQECQEGAGQVLDQDWGRELLCFPDPHQSVRRRPWMTSSCPRLWSKGKSREVWLPVFNFRA